MINRSAHHTHCLPRSAIQTTHDHYDTAIFSNCHKTLVTCKLGFSRITETFTSKQYISWIDRRNHSICTSWALGSDSWAFAQKSGKSCKRGSRLFWPIRRGACMVPWTNHMLMDKICKMCTIPNIVVWMIQKSYLPGNVHYVACSRQKLGAGPKL